MIFPARGNTGSSLEHSQQYGGIKPVNGNSFPFLIIGYTEINKQLKKSSIEQVHKNE
jgi:hypothetical protein